MTAGRSPTYWDTVLPRLGSALSRRYQIIRLLGHGGMAGVFLARETRLGRGVAIKVMTPSIMTEPSLVDRFVREARTIAQLGHPNIVTIFDVDQSEEFHYFAMQYVPGRTLSEVMAESLDPLPLSCIGPWLYQIASALDHAHENGVVHRDIKPSNIILNNDGDALVTDFGIAKVVDEPNLTRTDFVIGTPAYMSPEQCAGEKTVSGASDQYSLGALAYQLITGEPPFSGPTLAIIDAHRYKQPRPITSLRLDCPPQLARAVMRMLEKRPEKRWPSIVDGVAAYAAIPPASTREGPRLEMRRLGTRAAAVEIEGVAPLKPGEQTQLTAIARSATGSILGRRKAEWVSDRADAVHIGESGAAQALAEGEAEIAAIIGGVAGRARIRVLPAPVRITPPTVATPLPTRQPPPVRRSGTGTRSKPVPVAPVITADPTPPEFTPLPVPDEKRRLWPWLAAGGTGVATIVLLVILLASRTDAGGTFEPIPLPPPSAPPPSPAGGNGPTPSPADNTPEGPVVVVPPPAPPPPPSGGENTQTNERQTVPPPAPPPPPPTYVPPGPLEGSIDELIVALETAMESGDVERVRRVYPALTEREPWWTISTSFGPGSIDVNLFRQNVVNQGTSAFAVYSGRVNAVRDGTARQSPPFTLRMQFERTSSGAWRFTSIGS